MKKMYCLVIVLNCLFIVVAQQKPSVSFEQWISLKQYGNPVIAPDGKLVAYPVTSTDWASNRYDVEIWISKTSANAAPYQLTRTNKGSSTMPQFSPDGKWLSFLADRGDKNQLYLISPNGGEAFALTKDEEGIDNYKWSPDGKQIAFVKANAEAKKEKSIAERYGAFDVEDEGFKQNGLWVIDFNEDSIEAVGLLPCYSSKEDSASKEKASPCKMLPKPVQLVKENYFISNFDWSPDGKNIAYSFQSDSRVKSSLTSNIAVFDMALKKATIVVKNPSSDVFAAWSPDSRSFVYVSNLTDTTSSFYKNNKVLVYDLEKKTATEIVKGFDEQKSIVGWNSQGIYFTALQKMRSYLYQYNPADQKETKLEIDIELIGGVDISGSGQSIAIAGRNFNALNEIYVLNTGSALQKITNASAQIEKWNTPVNEIVSWKSKDGSTIEGVLLKPKNFSPDKKYPLLVVIHGGPTGVDRPEPVPTYVYPIMEWCEKGAIVLRINYRGSAGYGEKFRSLNLNNLGVGDMWDVLSGVDYLTKKGFVDTARMGCMGWSQGGYISAFLTTNTTIFKAISVGAGISDWMTYYVNTDITPFTRQYLQSTPWSNPSIYQKTSPIANITKARTPTLIQHGELDKRVPIPNAFELYRGLLDNGVTAKLVIYKGFGHGITKPKERLAATWHNWIWFNHYVFGDKMEELPVRE